MRCCMRSILFCMSLLIVLSACASQVANPQLRQVGPDDGQLIRRLAELSPTQIDPSQAGRVLNLEQTVNGVVVRVHSIYADEQRLIIGYTIHGPAEHQYRSYNIRLVDAAGHPVPMQGEIGVNATSQDFGVVLVPGQAAFVREFRRSMPDSASIPANYTFTLEVKKSPPPDQSLTLPNIAQELQPQPDRVSTSTEQIDLGETVASFTFALSIP
jgi:hypothetical protein